MSSLPISIFSIPLKSYTCRWLIVGNVDMHQEGSSKNLEGNNMPIWNILIYVNCANVLIMVLGTMGSVVDGFVRGVGVLILHMD